MGLVVVAGAPLLPMRFECEVCGRTGTHSVDANIRAATAAIEAGDIEGAVKKAGRWYCGAKDGEPCCSAAGGVHGER